MPHQERKHYACDGCGEVYALTEAEADSINRDDWCQCGAFRGWMLVGGKAHELHLNGGSPWQAYIAEPVAQVYTEHTLAELEAHLGD